MSQQRKVCCIEITLYSLWTRSIKEFYGKDGVVLIAQLLNPKKSNKSMPPIFSQTFYSNGFIHEKLILNSPDPSTDYIKLYFQHPNSNEILSSLKFYVNSLPKKSPQSGYSFKFISGVKLHPSLVMGFKVDGSENNPVELDKDAINRINNNSIVCIDEKKIKKTQYFNHPTNNSHYNHAFQTAIMTMQKLPSDKWYLLAIPDLKQKLIQLVEKKNNTINFDIDDNTFRMPIQIEPKDVTPNRNLRKIPTNQPRPQNDSIIEIEQLNQEMSRTSIRKTEIEQKLNEEIKKPSTRKNEPKQTINQEIKKPSTRKNEPKQKNTKK